MILYFILCTILIIIWFKLNILIKNICQISDVKKTVIIIHVSVNNPIFCALQF